MKVPITQRQLQEQRAEDDKKAKKGKARASMGDETLRGKDGKILEWCEYVQQFDVVVTTYQVLRSDFNVARVPPVRPRREDVVYATTDRPRSPLVMVEWNRVIMDEVQMVGGSNLECVIRS